MRYTKLPEPGAARRVGLALCLWLALAALTACESLPADVPAQAAGPNLALLSLPAYDDPEAQRPQASDAGAEYSAVDLWLDATQNMGGINPNEKSMYPHTGKKYREGGFQYRYGTKVGWYENVLMDMLAAAGETHVRALRYGNETLPAALLATHGLTAADAAGQRSVWRDLHTVSQALTAGFFQEMSAEDMAQSFYALGAPAWLNRVGSLAAQALENPSLAGAMEAAQAALAEGIAAGNAAYRLAPGEGGEQCALYAALENLDTRKLSIVTVDPASVGKTAGAAADGMPIAYYEQLLRDRGVFDLGLCVGVLDFQLDYLGQMGTFSTAALSEPLLWGRVILDEKKQTFENLGVMPRRMLTLVIGSRTMVDSFIARLSQTLEADPVLKGLRGPQNGELSYTAAGQTVTQQPFAFAWNHTLIARPGMGYYTQHTDGAVLAQQGETTAAETAASGLPLVRLNPDETGAQPDRTLQITFSLSPGEDGTQLDVSALTNARVEPLYSLLLADVLPNTPQNAATLGDGFQTIAYRDRLYVFDEGAKAEAFTLKAVQSEAGTLTCTVAVRGAALVPGYYRLRLTANATGEQVSWEPVAWIDGAESVSVAVTDAQVFAWETFTAAMTQYDRDAKGLPRMFAHAWGGATDKLYHGLRVPDFPPVYKSVRLAELVAQLRAAAASGERPLIRYAFEVFVPNP